MSERILGFLKATIPSFNTEEVSNKLTTLYKIVMCDMNGATWEVHRSYRDFAELHTKLLKDHPKLPILPPKTFFPLKSTQDLENRRLQLELYTQGLISDVGLLFDPEVVTFLNASQTEIGPESISLVSAIVQLPFPITDFLWEPKEGYLFVALRDDTKIKNSMILKPHCYGYIACYKKSSDEGSHNFELLWKRRFSDAISTIDYDSNTKMMAVGQFDGKITVLKVLPKISSVVFVDVFEKQFMDIKIVKLDLSANGEYIYCFYENSYINVYDLKQKKVLSEYHISFFTTTSITIDKHCRQALTADTMGQITVLDISTNFPQPLLLTEIEHKENIIGMIYKHKSKKVFALEELGIIKTIQLSNHPFHYPEESKGETLSPSKEIKEKIRIKAKIGGFIDKKCTALGGQAGREKIYLSCGDGTLVCVKRKGLLPLYQARPHNGAIVKMIISDEDNLLFTAGEDNSIKIFKLEDESNSMNSNSTSVSTCNGDCCKAGLDTQESLGPAE